MIFIGHSIQKQQITLSFQVRKEHSPGYITSWIKNQASVNLEKIEIISNIFPDYNTMRLEMSYRGKNVKNTNTWRLNNTLLNNQEVTEEIKEEIKKYIETNYNENIMIQNLWDTGKQF